MEGFASLHAVVLWAILLFFNQAASISPISAKGSKLFDEDGRQFFVKGVHYAGNSTLYDPLLDRKKCEIDAGLMKSLGVNTIRVFGADSTKNHDDCMDAFARQGIYVWLELAIVPNFWIDRIEPKWTMAMYNNWTSTVDEFAGYDNLLSFTIASATMDNTTDGSLSAPYVKAATRDLKAFRDARGYRQVPISYASFDYEPLLSISGSYLTCGDEEDAIELLGVEIYGMCDNNTVQPDMNNIHKSFQKYNIPMVFTTVGCIEDKEGNRDFSDLKAIFNSTYLDVFSGAILWQWSQQGADEWGFVEYSNEAQTGTPSIVADYSKVSTILSTIDPIGTYMFSYQPTATAPACPTSNSASDWIVNPSQSLPTIAGLNVKTVTPRTSTVSSTTEMSMTQSSTAGTGSKSASVDTDSTRSKEEVQTGSSLSRNSVIGVAVGSTVGGLALIAVAVWLLIRKRASAKAREVDEGQESEKKLKTELPGLPVAPRQELDVGGNGQNGSDPSSTASYLPPYQSSLGSQMLEGCSPTVISEAQSIPIHEMSPSESSPESRGVEGFAPMAITQAQPTAIYEMPDSTGSTTHLSQPR